jgi:4-amino-4-deoxy-L-arabinose transferase-like glycosyltransferase
MKTRKLILAGIVLGWASATIVAYYVFHKPLYIEQALAIGKLAWAIFVATLVFFSGAGIGRLLVGRKFRDWDSFSFETLAFEIGFGLGILALVWLGIGLIGVFQPIAAWAMLIFCIFVSGRQALEWGRNFLNSMQKLAPRSRIEFLLALFVIIMVAISFLDALSPPTEWDALLYHLAGPKADIAAGKLQISPWLPETGYPQVVEMLYTWAMLLGSPNATGIIHWSFGLFTLLLVWEWGKDLEDSQSGWLGCAILISATTFISLMGRAYIDAATIFFASVGFAALRRWINSGSNTYLVLSGISAGLAFGTKYTGVVVGVGLACLIIINHPRQTIRNLLIFGLPAVVISIPWLLKNFILAGNPTYPFFFGGIGWDNIRGNWYSQPGSGLLYTEPWKLLASPFIMTIVGEEGRAVWHATFGPLFTILVPAIAIRWKHHTNKTWLRNALLFFATLFLVWLYGAAVSKLMIQPRFLFPGLPPIAVLCAISFNSLRSLKVNSFSVHRILGGLIALVLMLTVIQTGMDILRHQNLGVLAGVLSEEDYLYHRLGWYYAAINKVSDLPEGSQVIFLFEPRSYHCPPQRCFPDGILDIWYHARRQGGIAASLAQKWREEGFTHVLLYNLGAQILREANKDIFMEEDWVELERLTTDQLSLIENFGDSYMLFELASK